MKKILISSLLIMTLFTINGCSNSPMKRNSWQKNNDFKAKRDLYYNQFVETGGMIPDESNPTKKAVQDALNQGSYLSDSN